MSGADNAGHATKVPAQPHSGSERGVQQPRNWYFASILRYLTSEVIYVNLELAILALPVLPFTLLLLLLLLLVRSMKKMRMTVLPLSVAKFCILYVGSFS